MLLSIFLCGTCKTDGGEVTKFSCYWPGIINVAIEYRNGLETFSLVFHFDILNARASWEGTHNSMIFRR